MRKVHALSLLFEAEFKSDFKMAAWKFCMIQTIPTISTTPSSSPPSSSTTLSCNNNSNNMPPKKKIDVLMPQLVKKSWNHLTPRRLGWLACGPSLLEFLFVCSSVLVFSLFLIIVYFNWVAVRPSFILSLLSL